MKQTFLLSLMVFLFSCDPSFEDINHSVTAIHKGHTLELKGGELIQLIGIEGSSASQQYLEEHILNRKVNIQFDSYSYPPEVLPGQIIKAYVILSDGQSLNGTLLKEGVAFLNGSELNYDSISTFKNYLHRKVGNQNIYQNEVPNEELLIREDVDSEPPSDFGMLVANVEKSVFLVSTFDGDGKEVSQGTGFFINDNGYGVSNYHVFEHGRHWQITTHDRAQFEVEEIVKSSKEYDYVIFKVKGNLTDYPFLNLSQKRNPRKADDIFVVGNPLGLESTFTRGVVSALRSINQPGDIIQFDAAISPGSSGSPLMNMKGEVLGIATMKFKGCENCNFAMNIHLLEL